MALVSCIDDLTGDFQKDCENPPIIGLEENAFIIPYEDIDRAATTFNSDKTAITSLAFVDGALKIPVQAFKKFKDGGYEMKENADSPNGATHMFSFVSPKNTTDSKAFLNALMTGARCVVVVERKWKGLNNVDAFEVLGYNVGMTGASTMKYYADNGSHVVTLKTPADEQEPKVPYTFIDTDYATTKTEVDSWY